MKKIMNVFMTTFMVLSMSSVAFASEEAISESVGKIVNAVSYFGYAIAIGMIVYIGAKYAMSPANEKADVKQGTINYLIGAFFIICASTVASLFVNIAAGEGTGVSGLASSIVGATGGLTMPSM